MKIKLFIIIGLVVLYFNFPASTFACRYTVREIGFSDLGAQPYRLYFFTSDDQPGDRAGIIGNISRAVLSDANVLVSVVNIKNRDDPAMDLLRFWQVEPMEHAILTSPQGQSIVLPLDRGKGSFKEAVWSVLEAAVSSPLRQKICKNIIKHYGIVLLVEGTNDKVNQQASTNIRNAIKEIKKVMVQMPKPTDKPPVLLKMSFQQREKEKILLWSLGMDPADTTEPVMVSIYGRGRKMGPLVKGERITENSIFNLLNLIGADCECGMDRSWMLGMMIPMRWDVRMQKETVDHLGFDAENPIIRTEMSQILSIRPQLPSSQQSTSGFAAASTGGYSEAIINFKSDIEIPRVPMSQIQQSDSQNSFLSFHKIVYILFVVALIILSVGAFILSRARRQRY